MQELERGIQRTEEDDEDKRRDDCGDHPDPALLAPGHSGALSDLDGAGNQRTKRTPPTWVNNVRKENIPPSSLQKNPGLLLREAEVFEILNRQPSLVPSLEESKQVR